MAANNKTVVVATLWMAMIAGCHQSSAPNVTPPSATRDAPVTGAVSAVNVSASTPAPRESPGAAWFVEMTHETGVDFCHQSGTNDEKPFPAANGSGLGAFDFDLDGWCDLYFATGKPFPLDPASVSPTNRCYRNLGGWRFEDVTNYCGLGHTGYSAGVAVGDFDSDGFPDVYVGCYGANVLYRNCGDGTFVSIGEAAGVADERWAASAAFLDGDGDGLLDLYVCNYAKWTWKDRRWCGDRKRNLREYCSPHSVEPERDVFYRNLGDGTFADATADAGLGETAGRAQGVVAADFNHDGRCDLYVGNDLNANSLFFNQGQGKFEDASELSGAAYDSQGNMQAGMGVDVADVNGDSLPELFVTNFSNEHNSLYENLGSGLYQDSTQSRGLYRESIPCVGWGTALTDFNLDGWPDLIVTNGLLNGQPPFSQPALLWQNIKGQFQVVSDAAGSYFLSPHAGRGLATADLDNDGDLDVIIAHHDERPALLSNQRPFAPDAARSVNVRLVGVRGNRDGIGATISAQAGQWVSTHLVKGGGSYLSASPVLQVIAVPSPADALRCRIRWPDGDESVVADLRPGATYAIVQSASPASEPTIFEVLP